jgi:prepilin-type N-terminal cleavage/methylation domain-containing protein
MKVRGFTLIEMVLSIAMLGVMMLALGPGLRASLDKYNLLSARRQAISDVRSGMDRMVSEIRLIPASAQVISIGATSFQFQYPAGTPITYSLSGGNLMRNSDILISNVSSLAFAYYDQSGAVTATTSAVRAVSIQLTADVPSTSTSYTLRTRVFLTNTGNYYANFTSP